MARPKKQVKTENVHELTSAEKILELRTVFYNAVAFDRALDLDEWSDSFRILPRETSSEFGQWVTQRFPFLRKIMKALSPSSIARMIVVMKGAQLGFTELAICWILYNAERRPGPCMYVQKTDDAAKDFSIQKLKPSILVCSAVDRILGDLKPKRYANSWDNKAYPGGFAVLGGANSSAFLRSKSVRDAILDEEDTYAANISGEGSPVRLIGKRMVNFPDRKMFRLSTPVLEELSTISPAFDAGSEEWYYVPCPHCNPEGLHSGNMFILDWELIKWTKEIDPQTGYPLRCWTECPHCAEPIDEAPHKTWMLNNGDWFSTKNNRFDAKGEEVKNPARYKVGDVANPSFNLSSFYSPHGFFGWDDAVTEWFDYKRTNDVNLLQVIVNQTFAQTFTLAGQEISYSYLYQRRAPYAGKNQLLDVPSGALCLTAGVDIQDDRIEIEVVGWGMLEENWGIDYAVLPGDTSMMGDRRGMLPDGQPSVWRMLDEFLMKRFIHASGALLPIEVTMIDAGYKTEEVHTFCRLRESRRIFPVKGKDGWGKGLWSAGKRRHERYHTVTYEARTDELKNKVYAMLQIDQPGPGFCHYPKKPCYSEKYFKGLTCETRRVKMVNGHKKLYWHTPSGARNEPLDLRNYAYVAFHAYPVNLEERTKHGLPYLFPSTERGTGRAGSRLRRRRGSPGL